ncbi:MAG: hypothetical protein WAS21_02370 [Geminicoccaceae bacterium]|jgi:hypothetical protein
MEEHVSQGSKAAERQETVVKRPAGREARVVRSVDPRETDADRYRRRVAARGRLNNIVLDEDVPEASH